MKIPVVICLLIPTILLSQNRKKAERAYAKAVEFYQQSADKRAEDLAKQALRQDATFIKPYLLLGQLSENEQKLEQAISLYLKGSVLVKELNLLISPYFSFIGNLGSS